MIPSAEIVIAHPLNVHETTALKAFLHALNIRFELSSEELYNKDFVKSVLEADLEIKNGKSITVNSESFDALWK